MRLHVAVAVSIAVLAPGVSADEPALGPCGLRYDVVDLGSLGGPNTVPFALNNAGTVVGFSEVMVQNPDGEEEARAAAFRWRRGTMVRLVPSDDTGGSVATDVNGRGDAVGCLEHGLCRATLWRDGSTIDLGMPAGTSSSADAVNGRGQVAGSADGPARFTQAFRWEDGAFTFLGTLGGLTSFAHGMNEQGSVVGSAELPDRLHRAFLWRDGVMTNLGTLGGIASVAMDVNERHLVVGSARLPDDTDHACAWHEGVIQDLGTLEGDRDSRAMAVNRSGHAVGVSYGQKASRAVLWQRGRAVDLNQRIRPGTGWLLAEAFDINDRGWIVGTGSLAGVARAYLLKPALLCR
jgi:probable HAF family extracellular repeat protein